MTFFINTDTFNVQATLPAVQSYLKDSYGLNGNIMISQGEYNNISLKSVCGWLKLQLTGNGEKVKSITLKGNNGEQVAGELYINSADATAILSSDAGNADDGETGGAGGGLVFEDAILKEVVLDCGEGVELGAEPTVFYIALPPQTFEQGLTVDVNCKGYNPMSITTQKVVAIERNHIQPMAEVAFSSEVRTIANNEIWYVAPQKIDRSNWTWTYDTFGANVVSNEWDSLSGEGIITFDGEVTKIGDKAFQSANITSITLSDSVILIGAHAFEWCQSLSSIQIPANVERIGMLAFYNSAISEITFKTSKLTTIEDGAFLNCAELIEINLPTSITHIGGSVFRGCTKLEGINMGYTNAYMSVGLPDCQALTFHDYEKNITTIVAYPAGAVTQKVSCFVHPYVNIAWGAFWDCDHIVEVWLSLIRSIEQMNFCYCDNLEYINLDEVEHIANDVLSYCSNLKGLSLPRVESIGSHTFCDNESLEYISLNSEYLEEVNTIANDNISLTTINLGTRVSSIINSFNGCAAITEVYCKATTPPALTDSFDSMVAPTIYVPAESVNGYKTAESWKEFASYIVGYDFETGEVVPGQPNTEIWYTATETVEPYDTSVFGANIISNEWNAETGKGVMAFDGEVTMIGEDAFYGCSSLTSVNIPDSVTEIGGYAFYDCSNLTTIYIPYGVTDIFMYAFNGCSSLTSVNIPNGVTAIDDSAFEDCSSLTSITIPGSITSIGHSAFKYCSNLTSVNIPDRVTEIGGYAFSGCSSLTSITIPNSVTSIEDGIFNACSSLKSITLSENVTVIRSCAFDGCISLESVIIPDSVTSIGSYAFLDCSSLERVTIGNHVTSIGGSAFLGCSNLNGVYIRDLSAWCKISFSYWTYSNPLSNGVKLYLNNIEVTELTIPSDITEIKDNAFEGCISLTSLTISDSITSIGEWTFSGCSNLKSIYCKATTPPTGYSSMFPSDANDLVIYVPRDYVYDYQTADGWSSYADSIVGYDF